MKRDPDVKNRLLDHAQALIQQKGYNGFSYRDLADSVGIRSASIHYHYPAKADLGAAVADRYTNAFIDELHDAENRTGNPRKLLEFYASLFRRSLVDDDRMCLCGMLGAEIAALPPPVGVATKRFFELNLMWLSGVFRRAENSSPVEILAAIMLATLEGAMIMARTTGSTELFDRTIAELIDRLL